MTTTNRCACGELLTTSNRGGYAICNHCDKPALHITATCNQCRLIAVHPTR